MNRYGQLSEYANLQMLVWVPSTTAHQVAGVPEIAAGYRQLVLDLESALKSNVIEAREILRELLGPVVVRPEGDEVWADPKQNAAQAFAVCGIFTMVVAGTGFEPANRISGKHRSHLPPHQQ